MRGRTSVRDSGPHLLLVLLVAASLSSSPASASVHHDLSAELGAALSRSFQSLGLNLSSVFGTSTNPQSSPARALLDQSDCLLPVWSCPNCVTVPDSLYQTVNNSTCEPVSGLDLSVCGSSIVDESVVTAVRSGQCVYTCASQNTSKTCAVSPATAPGPSSAVTPAPGLPTAGLSPIQNPSAVPAVTASVASPAGNSPSTSSSTPGSTPYPPAGTPCQCSPYAVQ